MIDILDKEFEKALLREIYIESYYEFFKDAYKALLPNEIYQDNWHIKYLCDELQSIQYRISNKIERDKDLIINIPFRSAKSLIVTVVWPVWCWIVDPTLSFISTSFSASLAEEHSQKSKDLINSIWFQELFGDKIIFSKSVNSKSFYEIEGGGFRKAVGTGGQITGSGAAVIVCLPAGQEIFTEKGYIDIKEIVENKLDILVWSYNHLSNKKELKKIKRYDKNKGRKLIKIITESNKELICTEDHEVWTENRGYICAKNLTVDDIILLNEK